MGSLNDALPRENATASAEHAVKSERGLYKAFFIGITAPFEWVSDFAQDKCKNCRGEKTNKAGTEPCYLCNGSGKKTETRTRLRYHLENGFIEEEEVNYKLSPPSTGKDGNPLSPSTFFVRLRSLSEIKGADPTALDAWYTSLPTPIKVPCFVVIQDNRSGTALKITDVLPRAKGAATPPGPGMGAAPAERVPFNDDEPSPAEKTRAAVDDMFPDDSELPF